MDDVSHEKVKHTFKLVYRRKEDKRKKKGALDDKNRKDHSLLQVQRRTY